MALGYIVSYYLNALIDSSRRATVLSFKGVTFNLGYGFISLVFALALRAVRDGRSSQDAVARGFAFLPLWLLFRFDCLCHLFQTAVPAPIGHSEGTGGHCARFLITAFHGEPPGLRVRFPFSTQYFLSNPQ